MIELWKERLRRHQLDQFKYLRLIFNDTFVLAFIVLLGALGFWYSNILKTIHGELWFGKIVVVLLLFIGAQAGHLATLMEDPDSTFLLVREKEFYQYFKSAENYSRAVPIVLIAIVTFLLSPFAFQAASISVLNIVLLGVSAAAFKMLMLDVELLGLYNHHSIFGINLRLFVNVIYLILLFVSIYTFPAIAAIVSIIAWLVVTTQTKKLAESGQLQWQKAISDENQRMFRVKRFYNLFTDVPGVTSKIKRRKWLDFLFNGIKLDHKNTYLYLFARGVVRNNEYMGLFVRLTIVQVVLLALIDNFYISLICEMLFIYLVGFQLKPYFKEVMQNLMQRLYPVSSQSKIHDFTKISNIMLLIQWFVSIFAIVYKFGFSTNSVIILAAGLVVIIFLNYFYMPHQLKKYLSNGEY
ncbi:ABC transporter permease [Companilactobacillus sp.]|jgi:ABC-2 type transport system permease protein|uniref:ABC transporter permease n=1 Tax=Companilactobacillus sp. TaxID=2767905 RepID=UPI0025C30F27|nr:ABC transporter permease [Companilactobacillus sp.]MCH4007967.1 ABC transporter permease [Companilactobacillus sp.]MCH4051854.1 ABC transporter permease [Companilactobacillus sp.]MCH4075910.1 ABC transporter permease [Companilactobacillus sp.]MCH4124485.1 ABC transporter permease [Companilactobacillus sp.]MCH4132552.1 ABC transporter permease [Companilactobacillus sp.]